MSSPRVSIGLPVYNGANFLDRSIESVLNQDYADLELIIADNSSTDETEAICRQWAGRDARVRYYRNEKNLGAGPNYNRVFELARGEYFKWAAHDDECHSAMIGQCVQALDRAPASVVMVYPLGELIDEHGKTLQAPLDRIESTAPRPSQRLSHVFRTLNMCDPIFGLIRSDALRKTQLIGSFFGADYVLLGELAILGEIRELPEILFRLRAHPKRSMKAHKGARSQAAWYDPSAARKLFVMPSWDRMMLEMTKSVRNFDLPLATRIECCAAVLATHYTLRFRNMGGRVKRRLKARLGLDPQSANPAKSSLK